MENHTSELKSEATAIKLLGMALEKIENENLRCMGGRVSGNSVLEIITEPGDWRMTVKTCLIFDIKKLNKYVTKKDIEEMKRLQDALKQGYGLDETSAH